MIENIKPIETLTVADLKDHPVWEYLNDDAIGETMAQPVELPVETLDDRIVGTKVRLANGSEVWGLFSNFDVHNCRSTQHFLTLSIDRGGTWFHLARYHDVDVKRRGPEALARFLDLDVDDIFPITVDVRRYVQGSPAILTATVLKEPQERLTGDELSDLASGRLQ